MNFSAQRCLAAAAAVSAALGLAACGSRINPELVAGQPASGVPSVGLTASETGQRGQASVPGSAAGPDTSVGGTTTSGADSSGGVGGGGSHSGSGGEGGSGSASGGGQAASCAGLQEQTGISSDAITIANASDISGPVPGLFQSAQDGVAAYVAYFNATTPSGICGRKLSYLPLDSRTDAGADQAAYVKACDEAFAVVGSASAFDSGGAKSAEECGIPDIRATSLTDERGFCSVCFPTQSGTSNYAVTPGFDFYQRTNPEATASAAFLYIDVGGAGVVSKNMMKAAESRGFTVKYTAGVDVSEFNYSPYAQQLKDQGIKYVNFVAATSQVVRLAQAMQQVGYEPEIFDVTQEQYSPDYVSTGGDAVDGSTVVLPHPMFEDSEQYPELQLYLSWLQQVKPGAAPTTTGLFAWSAARLFVEQAVALGGKLTRPLMVDAVGKVHKWTGNDIHAPSDVGAKLPALCAIVVQLDGGSWKQISKPGYSCGELIKF